MAFSHGMNVDEVESLGRFLQERKGQIESITREIESKVNGAGWQGTDANRFKQEWWPEHQRQLTQIGEALHGFGQSALNNAREQREVSER